MTQSSVLDLTQLRRQLHRMAEPSGEERRTAQFVAESLQHIGVENLVQGVGGNGVLCSLSGQSPGPTVLLRADLDALPLQDDDRLEHASERAGCAHRCGHDGHMAMVLGVAQSLRQEPPARGRAVFLFQPAEETGQGAFDVLQDERFAPFAPDFALATHNLPGFELGTVVLRRGIFASASKGMCVEWIGRASHASEPAAGRSPIPAATQFAQELERLPQSATALEESAQITVVGVVAGGANYGINPGEARVMATLRAHTDSTMDKLTMRAQELARGLAAAHGLEIKVTWHEEFPATPCDDR
ncbi:MAG: amidohydrolase, partial [Planctomycetes bacterium]|nr:amidohydrolase [Planctomycetota bacterium]